MTKKQKHVLQQIMVAILFIACTVCISLIIWGTYSPNTAKSLKLASLIMFTMGIWELIFVLIRARQRFFIKSEIDGAAPKSGSSSDIQNRILNNTTEQVLIALPIILFTACFRPPAHAILMILVGCFFSLGRLLFWIGYHHMPTMRGFGFCLTIYPTVCLYLYALICLLGGWVHLS